MKKQYSQQLADEYQAEYEREAEEFETHIANGPRNNTYWSYLDRLDIIDTLADFWFGMAEHFERERHRGAM